MNLNAKKKPQRQKMLTNMFVMKPKQTDSTSSLKFPSTSNEVNMPISQNKPPDNKIPLMTYRQLVLVNLLWHQKHFKQTNFPKNGSRSFQLHWMEKYKWLEYSVLQDERFCFACRNFDLHSTKEDAFTITGSTQQVLTWFLRHERSTSHIQAMCSWEELLNHDKNESTVTELLINTILWKRRYFTTSIIEVIVF